MLCTLVVLYFDDAFTLIALACWWLINSSIDEKVEQFTKYIRDYWHVENKVHHVRNVTQREDTSRIRS
jgi:predicted transposase YbfD/YdcC